MPQVAAATSEAQSGSSRPNPEATKTTSQWFGTPQVIRHLFDRFPLWIHPVNELPQRSPQNRDRHTLWIFSTKQGAQIGAPSFNPGCLKWQAYLKFRDVDFVTTSSSNHASPSGALPFLLPASSSKNIGEAVLPIPSTRIERWICEKNASQDGLRSSDRSWEKTNQQPEPDPPTEQKSTSKGSLNVRYEAYMSLVNHGIRNAYLYSLYLSPPNFTSIVVPLYISPNTLNTLARFALSHQLRAAAETELLKQSPTIDAEALFQNCNKAFEALSELLGGYEFFFDEMRPGLFDASVFAYTHIFLDEGLDWKQTRLKEDLEQYGNLVEHRKRIMESWFRNETQETTRD